MADGRTRQAKDRGVVRVELRYDACDPAYLELLEESQRRGLGDKVQQHIKDLLQARYLAKHGDSLAALLWTPDPQPFPTHAPAPLQAADNHEPEAAEAAADAWGDMLFGDDE